ncbi:MAG: four helix bundle protein [Patescibacteria group bacterium]|nr:four helix bundle protein [Patescibacteria group bacterium]
MGIEKFEDIIAWKKSRVMAGNIYSEFRNLRDYGFRDQIERSAVSTMNNIAEGFGRRGNREFKRFLNIAYGSCCEVQSMLYLALDLGYINSTRFSDLFKQANESARLISALTRSISE